MNLITVHYRNVNDPGQDISTIPVWGQEGQLFDIGPYMNKLPSVSYPCYFDGVAQSASVFKSYPQDVVIMLRAYLKMRILFEDATKHNQVVGSHQLLARYAGKPLNYMNIGSQNMPNNYKLLDPIKSSFDSRNDKVFVPNATEIIYVQPVVRVGTGRQYSSNVKGYVNYIDMDTGNTKKVIEVRGHQGQKIDYAAYTQARSIPTNYQFVKLGNNNSYLANGAKYKIFVKPKEFHDFQSSMNNGINHQSADFTSRPRQPKVTGDVIYQDIDSNKIKKTFPVSGVLNQSIQKYTEQGSEYFPQGYHYVRLLSNHGTQLKPNAIYIILIKINQRNNDNNGMNKDTSRINASQSTMVTGYIVYQDHNTHQTVKTMPVTGPNNMNINYNYYIKAQMIPAGYRYYALNYHNGSHLQQGSRYVIWVYKLSQNTQQRPNYSFNVDQNNDRQQRFHLNHDSATSRIINDSKVNHNSNSHLPRVNDSQHDIGAILVALGKSLDALGHAINHR